MTAENYSPPLVTVGIATHNGGYLALNAIDSALNQTYQNLEIIVFDDCSNLEELEALKKKCSSDNRIKFFTQQNNLGSNGNYNAILAKSNGVFFTLFDQDDCKSPNFIKKCVEALLNDNNAVIAGGDTKVFFNQTHIHTVKMDCLTSNKLTKNHSQLFLKYMNDFVLYGVIRTRLLKEIGGWENNLQSFNLTTFKLLNLGQFVYVKDIFLEYTAKGYLNRPTFLEKQRHSERKKRKFYFLSKLESFFYLPVMQSLFVLRTKQPVINIIGVVLNIWYRFLLTNVCKMIYRLLFAVFDEKLPNVFETSLKKIAYPLIGYHTDIIIYSTGTAYKRGWPLR